MPWASLLYVIKHNVGSKLKLHWFLFSLHEGPWPCDAKKVCEKSSSMTLNEALFGRQPVSLCFYSFLRENKEWKHLMMINRIMNLSLIFYLEPPSCSWSYLFICMHCILLSTWCFFGYTCFAHSWLGCFIYLMIYASVSMLMLRGYFPFVILCKHCV
jgi:hypothetical protein